MLHVKLLIIFLLEFLKVLKYMEEPIEINLLFSILMLLSQE